MAEKNLGKFSVINSKLKLFEVKKTKFITKEIRLNALKKCKINKVQKLTLEYISKIRAAKIPLPEIKNHYIKNNRLFFDCRYMGKNILQELGSKSPKSTINDNSKLISDMIKMLKKAQKAGLSLDPHIKNFVTGNKNVYYVDFSPPYQKEYNRLVIKNAKPHEKSLVKKNLDAFSPSQLGYHFAADLLKEDIRFEKVMKEIYSMLLKEKVVSCSFRVFLAKVNEIKGIGQERIKRKIYLI